MKRIVSEYEFSSEQLNQVKDLARKFDLTLTTVKLLLSRGIDDEEKISRFLNPSASNFLSPFLMSGMREAVALLERAKEEGWNVAVYGDYDADGIGACSILYRALCEYGVEPYLYIPERTEGYGLNIGAIDQIFDEFLPDLFITVDCGISNRKEVEYIKEQGAFVIVTDHHELPDTIPDCICVNPKFSDDYPYDNLCGAGVAFKLAQAIIGERAYELLDIAALSTVADSVPLTGENRDVVAEGLRKITKNPRPAFSALLGKNAQECTAQTLAFSVAPRVNASGRMGDARCALRLFTTDDEVEIFELTAKLTAYNLERQKCCDEVYAQAVAQLKKQGAYGRVIMLVGEEWNAGFVGIVAARIAEEYARPALLFVRNGNMLKGSARSVEKVNIFDALKACSEYIEEFGGHAQAAGVNVKEENFEALYRALDGYIDGKYGDDAFTPTIAISEEISGAFPLKLARELNRLEPFGIGNKRPLFSMKASKTTAKQIKPLSPHLSVNAGGMDFMYFGGSKYLPLLKSDLDKTFVFECNLSKFRGKEYLKGFIRTVVYDGKSGKEVEKEGFENCVKSLRGSCDKTLTVLEENALNAFLENTRNFCPYGLCVIVYERKTLSRFTALSDLEVDVFEPSSGSLANCVIYAPHSACDLSGFREIVLLDRAEVGNLAVGNARIFVSQSAKGLCSMPVANREDLLEVFARLRQEDRIEGTSYADVARNHQSFGFSTERLLFALAVFEDLGLIEKTEFGYQIVRGKRTELTNSSVYSTALRLFEVKE